MRSGRIFPEIGELHHNLASPALVEMAVRRGEADLGPGGCLYVKTGTCTGRSPKDKFIAREAGFSDHVCWERNSSMDPVGFAALYEDLLDHIRHRAGFVQDLFCGADPRFRTGVRVVTTRAWHSLFIRHLLRIPGPGELRDFEPGCTVINCPDFTADPGRHDCRSGVVIATSLQHRLILIAGTEYGGENKKSVFSFLNYFLPDQNVMPMHCSANHVTGFPDDSAVVFGLSGTGKTTLSADPERTLVGDDEHGWSEHGIFNLEGGCYAKLIDLNPATEPEIHAASRMFGTVVENVVFDPDSRLPDYGDDSITANTRSAYPLASIPNASPTGLAGPPKHIVMLTCDAYGVLPPIAKLSPDQAVFHFLSGFTSKVSGTERGVTEPRPTFSACFGAPFMPRRPEDYGKLLRSRMTEAGSRCWLINTGWTGGAYGAGSRFPLEVTRRLLSLALNGQLERCTLRRDEHFGLETPASAPGIEKTLFVPRETWPDPRAYDQAATMLRTMFLNNYEKLGTSVGRAAVTELRAIG